MDKLSFLQQYRKSIEFVSNEDLLNIKKENIPKEWVEVFIETDKTERKDKLIALWNRVCEKELSHTISYLKENLVDVELIIDNGQYAILYSVKSENDEILYYEGGIPNKSIYDLDMQQAWSSVPQSIVKFYGKLHNGFYYMPSRAMGLVPLERVTYFKEDEWGILDDLEHPLEINLDTTYGFFENGMGGYVAVDLNNCTDNRATLWFTNDQPEYSVDFWDIVDEWILIGLQDN
ncbi:SMI1/KNR4 family protein [Priestia aryabhattai]|uniref:SMI1/KNR4 family protein n=1 Tax=Priestia aryabhattai TaxID=412384 RepID=UPI0008DD2F3D|nr:SMI1/KNR4 family protein [Priestia aryabhattai]MBZ6487481.1 SMI1/KNR4 family protein [Priestia aryabhattai]MDH3114338.1 SMI1/KNR4 family protein [Priestia aryabhattai]MDH3126764.1 SMI1/KNR4 family protein [Priestia aryabhattai]MDH3132992.1 SMI1/KNR4 family protein [Priestia aryabhattai]MED4153841.1 SMI1/KNR4 family protein [Priestia aryabhattai]